MQFRLLLTLVGTLLLTTSLTAHAGMKDFCAKRWHGIEAMQTYCMEVQDQSIERLAKLLDIIESTHEQLKISGSHPNTDVASRCSRQHHLKVFDTYHNQLVEACLVQYLTQLQHKPRAYVTHAQLDEF